MTLDEYQQAWKADAAQMQVAIDTELLAKEARNSYQDFQSTIFWRDVRETGTSLVLIPFWLALGFALSLPWTWYLTVLSLVWVVAFVLVDRRRHPQRPSEPGQAILFYAKESLTQVEHQIWLLRNVFWWYLLPFYISIMAFFLQIAWTTTGSWLEFALFAGFLGLFLVVIYGASYRLNQRAVRKQLEPRRQDLLNVVASLEGQASNGDSGDIMELVSKINTPVSSAGLNSGWAENWNRIIPSWREAVAIVLPTLAGALCGFYSGLRIPEMGPTLFQSVVGAVIPFEIALGWIWYRSYKKQKLAESKDQEPNSLAAEVDKPRLVPRAPAVLIIFLILFLSVMAVVAIVTCVTHLRSAAAFSDEHRPAEPSFGDVSAFSASDIEGIDAWLRAQVDRSKYPSLTVAILRDGKVVYGRAFGFENIKSGKKATLQTPYHVASVTKAFTASLAVMLHEQGVIDLDHPVVDYLPDGVAISTSPTVGATITMRQLASHTSGLPRGVPGRVQSVEGWYELEAQWLYDHLARVELESAPGTQELYSNLAFGLLGHALENAADKPFDQLVQEVLCKPLALEQTAIQVDDKLQPATGYDDSGWQFESTHSFRERLAGSGGLVASVEDLTKFLAAQMEPGVLTSEMHEELHTRTRLTDEIGSMTGTALGWSIGWSSFVGRILHKNGGRSNCSAWIGFAPEYGVGVAVVTNCGGPDVDSIGRWLLERSVPEAYKPATKHGYARVAPFTGVRWTNDGPLVRVQDRWYLLVSINGISIERIMQFAGEEYGAKARKRFTEDVVRLLSEMGHEPDWSVSLGLIQPDGEVEYRQVRMTQDNRSLARENAAQAN